MVIKGKCYLDFEGKYDFSIFEYNFLLIKIEECVLLILFMYFFLKKRLVLFRFNIFFDIFDNLFFDV